MTTDEEPLQTVSLSRTATRPLHHSKNINNEHLKIPNGTVKLSKPAAAPDSNVDSTQGAGKSLGKTPQTAGRCGPSRKLKTSANSHDSTSTLPLGIIAPSALSCVDDMNLLSLRSPAKTCSAPQNMQMAMKGKPAESPNSKLILLKSGCEVIFVLCTLLIKKISVTEDEGDLYVSRSEEVCIITAARKDEKNLSIGKSRIILEFVTKK